jgi:hypothetical protein
MRTKRRCGLKLRERVVVPLGTRLTPQGATTNESAIAENKMVLFVKDNKNQILKSYSWRY